MIAKKIFEVSLPMTEIQHFKFWAIGGFLEASTTISSSHVQFLTITPYLEGFLQ